MAENLSGTPAGTRVGGENRQTEEGGAVVDGIYIPPGTQFTPLEQLVPADWEAAAKEIYGGYYAILEKFPELKKLLMEAIAFKYSREKFQYELRQTEWYKTTTSSAREWDISAGLDPETARQQIADQAQKIRQSALNMGVRLTDNLLNQLAENSLRFAWTEQDLNVAIADEANRGGGSALAQGFFGQQARSTAADFGVRLSDSTLSDWATRLATGQETFQSYQDYLLNSAKALYPTLAGGFDRGLSFGQMTDPYAQVASRILEIPVAQVDFTDPKWAQAFTMKNEKGEQVPMTYGEWSDYLRTNPAFGYEYTDEAVNKAYTVVNQLAELFGRA